MRVLIAGCGDVGTRLGLLLAADGHEVWGVRRKPKKLPKAIQGIAADLAESWILPLPADLDIVYYTAAADRSTDDAYQRAYVAGLRNVLAATGDVERAIFVSSTSVYDQQDGEWVDETSTTEPAGFRGRRILEAEALLAESSRRTVAVRFAGIYGPGRTRLIDSVRRSEAVCYEDPPLYTNRIHVDDCAAVLRHLGGLTDPHEIYLGVDEEPAPDGEVKGWLARRLGVSSPPPADSGASGRRGNKRCSNRRLLESGYSFLYPDYRDGYGSMLDAETG